MLGVQDLEQESNLVGDALQQASRASGEAVTKVASASLVSFDLSAWSLRARASHDRALQKMNALSKRVDAANGPLLLRTYVQYQRTVRTLKGSIDSDSNVGITRLRWVWAGGKRAERPPSIKECDVAITIASVPAAYQALYVEANSERLVLSHLETTVVRAMWSLADLVADLHSTTVLQRVLRDEPHGSFFAAFYSLR